MANNGHMNRDRIYDDRDEGNRWGDRPEHGIERGGQGQSGYTAGRSERDRSLDTQSYNQGYGAAHDRHDIGADDRFGSRGGSDYTDERMGFSRHGGDERMSYSRGGYPRSNDWVSSRSSGSATDRAYRTDPRSRNEHNMRRDRGMGPDAYGGNRGYDQGYGGMGGYGSRGFDDMYRNRNDEGMGGHGGQSIHGDYGMSESERGVWSTDFQRGRQGAYSNFQGGTMGNSQGSNLGNNAGWGEGVSHTGHFREQYGTERSEGRPSHRGKGPQGWQRSDERIKDLVCEALTDDHYIDASGIDVEVKNGDVTLSGMVPDRQTKRMAEDLIERISGVKDVTNQLKVSADERMKYGQASQHTQSGHSQTGQNAKDSKKAQA